ncbi:MAG: hypothetical protein V7642_7019 [Burkholderiales bacterium]|jgi:hypothetical protein
MKHLDLSKDERRTLREMGIFHPIRGHECGRKGYCN